MAGNIRIVLGLIRRVDYEKRLMDIEALDGSGSFVNVRMIGSFNDLSVPIVYDSEGDEGLGRGMVAVVVFDNEERPWCIGYFDPNYSQKIKKFLLPKIRPGEKFLYGDAGQELYFNKSGDVVLRNDVGDGFELRFSERLFNFKSVIFEYLSLAGSMVFGIVKRTLGNIVQKMVKGGRVAVEFAIKIFQPSTGLNLIHWLMGDVYDGLGVPEVSSFARQLRFLLRSFNEAGLEVSSIKIDEDGNIEVETLQNIKIKTTVKLDISSSVSSLEIPTNDWQLKILNIKGNSLNLDYSSILLGGSSAIYSVPL